MTPAPPTGEPKAAGDDPAGRFAALARAFAGEPDVGRTRAFGCEALTTGAKIFAMLARGRLVVKLPRQEVDRLLETGAAARFDPGHGRPMREWADIRAEEADWLTLATKARRFVAAESAGSGREGPPDEAGSR